VVHRMSNEECFRCLRVGSLIGETGKERMQASPLLDQIVKLAAEGIEARFVTTSKAAKIAENHGLVTQEFRDNASSLALHKEVRRAQGRPAGWAPLSLRPDGD